MRAERVRLLNPRTWLGKRPAEATAIPNDVAARIIAQETDMDRQIIDGTFRFDALAAGRLRRRLLG